MPLAEEGGDINTFEAICIGLIFALCIFIVGKD